MSTSVIEMFPTPADAGKVAIEADRVIGAAVKNTSSAKATWRSERWFVPVPRLSYDSKDIPQLVIEVNTYLVAAIAIESPKISRMITLTGGIGKPEVLTIPMIFLHAVLEKDLGRFSVVAKDAVYTTWDVPGAKPVRLPNEFITTLLWILKYEPVVAWLLEFGAQGKSIAPLVAGSLFGLAFQDSTQPMPANKEVVTTNDLISALESMAFEAAEAREMVRRVAPRLRADMTLEDAIRITLQTEKGED